jgi:chitodextrinase
VCGSDTTAPSVPTGLAQSAATSSTNTLTWTASTDPDSPVSGYNVYRGGTQVGTSSTTSYTDTGLAGGTTYSYTVSAYDPAGNTSAQSSALSATTNTCSISVVTNTFDTTWDGYVGYQNKGTGAETNPTVHFTLPPNIHLTLSEGSYTCTNLANDTWTAGSSMTAVSCSQSGSVATYSFTGSLAAGGTLTLYYTTDTTTGTEPVATGINVTGTCP